MVITVPSVKFSNNFEIPILGLGTWKSTPQEVTQAVKDAIDIGYRHIDCAHVYENEKEVGIAISAKLSEGVIKREDLFVTSKLWNTFHRPDLVEGALRETLSNLGIAYLDLFLMHWPTAYKEGDELFPVDENGKAQFSYVDYVDTWKAMEILTKKGLAKSIGLSNFNKHQIGRILEIATVPPVNNQVECHPYLNQKKLLDFCRSKSIIVTGFSPLGCPYKLSENSGDILLENPRIKQLATKYKKNPAHILLRYQIQRGVVIIPKSVTKSRIQDNFKIFDFEINSEDMDYLDSFDCNRRFGFLNAAFGHPHHPFENAEY